MDIKIVAQNIKNNINDYTAFEIENLFKEYAEKISKQGMKLKEVYLSTTASMFCDCEQPHEVARTRILIECLKYNKMILEQH